MKTVTRLATTTIVAAALVPFATVQAAVPSYSKAVRTAVKATARTLINDFTPCARAYGDMGAALQQFGSAAGIRRSAVASQQVIRVCEVASSRVQGVMIPAVAMNYAPLRQLRTESFASCDGSRRLAIIVLALTKSSKSTAIAAQMQRQATVTNRHWNAVTVVLTRIKKDVS